MTAVDVSTMRAVEGGTTYACPWCGHQGGYWNVYYHVLRQGCFKQDPYLEYLWQVGWGLIRIGGLLKGLLYVVKK